MLKYFEGGLKMVPHPLFTSMALSKKIVILGETFINLSISENPIRQQTS